MKIARETGRWIALAAFAPLLVFATLQIAGSLQQQRRDIEAATLDRAEAVNNLLDRALMADLGALSVLATAPSFATGDALTSRQRAMIVQRSRPHWRNVILTDTVSGRELWTTIDAPGETRPPRQAIAAYLAGGAAMGGIAADGCRCITMHVSVGAERRYVITVERDTADFHRHLLSAVADDEVAAVVDRDGDFIVRSLDNAARQGTPATQYVRDAVARGQAGIYRGRTYEGFENRTAYATSALTGWSTHVAVSSSELSFLDAGWAGATMLAGLVALIFAAGLTIFGVREAQRRRMEEQSRVQRQKLESLGQMAGEVAHDFNNLLTPILGNLKRLEGRMQDERDARAVEQALLAAERGAALAQQLLAFARDKNLEIACIDLRALTERMRPLLEQSLGAQNRLSIAIAESAGHALSNEPQLEVALLNLALNARDAMPDGGAFEIRAESAPKNGWLNLIVRDTGAGMPPEIAARAADPFFTTKDGHGTGLGLAQVHSLAVASEGALQIDSKVGAGTTITLQLRTCTPAAR